MIIMIKLILRPIWKCIEVTRYYIKNKLKIEFKQIDIKDTIEIYWNNRF